ncbi:uncharacterized protein LOC114264113 [Camellia sinensis]|uniref:uncharacterized protein LOC114264113 n=1 Tax=Camellia sinensis TaxID=4442 RepID=UPI0010360F3B|nr:uncharacterized protein LOC114264113 [Camellia sinensis]
MGESFNNLILEARGKTTLPLLEDIRCILMRRLQVRSEVMRAYLGPICPNIQQVLEKRKENESNCIDIWAGSLRYQINWFNGQQFVVDLADSTCLCRKWDLTGMSYGHAISVLYDKHKRPEYYVAHWYNKETYLASYKPMIYPINGSEM